MARGVSVMEPAPPLAAAASGLKKKAAGAAPPASLAKLGSEAFAALAEAEVDCADLFMHRCGGRRAGRARPAGCTAAGATALGGSLVWSLEGQRLTRR
jgi:hypothetical protein